jgi:arylsulfatase A-like enzyme
MDAIPRSIPARRSRVVASVPAHAQAPAKKPNILVIFGDDIGISQVSAYTMGLMGYRTPNIDCIANEGALFTDFYGQQSCTAGRAAFILGEEPFRTGGCSRSAIASGRSSSTTGRWSRSSRVAASSR